ncbi:MAG: hypothetical protein E7286_02455 [Lachnospiraceae bacterium]|nr:hypothetical protein [Lachnospiraceae bacterium]
MNDYEEYCLVRFHKKTGKIDTSLEAMGYEQLKKWAMAATTRTKESIIFNKSTGEIKIHILGSATGNKLYEYESGDNIEAFCPGLLAALNS